MTEIQNIDIRHDTIVEKLILSLPVEIQKSTAMLEDSLVVNYFLPYSNNHMP